MNFTNLKKILFVAFVGLLFLPSCNDNINDMGKSVLPPSDLVVLCADTFHLFSSTKTVDSIFAEPDSFLLGSFYDPTFGLTNADIFAQVMCPLGFTFPNDKLNFAADSVKFEFSYFTWTGDENALMRVNAYEMTGATFDFSTKYPTNIKVEDYCNKQNLLISTVIKAKDTSRDSTYVSLKLPDEFLARFVTADPTVFTTREKFLDFFKGIYLTTDFGISTMLNLYGINLRFYYHYEYIDESGNTITTKLNKLFPANSEVRQVNRIEHDRADITIADTVSYVSSPANFFTVVDVPLKHIKETMTAQTSGKKLMLSTALLDMAAVGVSKTNFIGIPTYMLLVKEDAAERFFKNRTTPTANDTCATYCQYATKVNDTDTTYTYSFELSRLIANELHNAEKSGIEPVENLRLLMIPISLKMASTSSTTYVTGANHLLTLSGVKLKNHKAKSPLRLKVIYNGF